MKDLLFYSNYCEPCKDLLGLLIRRNLRDQFVLICVDNKNFTIPKFVTCVPLIFTEDKRVIKEDDIQRYISPKMNAGIKSKNTNSNSESNINEDISPFTMGNSLNSSQFTFITEDGEGYIENNNNPNKELLVERDFTLLGGSIKSIQEKETQNNKVNKLDDGYIDNFLNSRAYDDEIIKSKIKKIP